MKVKTNTNLIDQLGAIDVQIKALKESADRLKKQLISNGVGVYQGESFVVEVQQFTQSTISPSKVRELADKDFVALVTDVKEIDRVIIKPTKQLA